MPEEQLAFLNEELELWAAIDKIALCVGLDPVKIMEAIEGARQGEKGVNNL